MRPRLWRVEPGDQLRYHVHEQQEELYHVVKGTGQLIVGSDQEMVEIPEGGFFKPGIKTPRQIRNDTDETTIW
ncbi:MAG: cupin domain-containing protein, partial [Halobacteriaceae archaeon]